MKSILTEQMYFQSVNKPRLWPRFYNFFFSGNYNKTRYCLEEIYIYTSFPMCLNKLKTGKPEFEEKSDSRSL